MYASRYKTMKYSLLQVGNKNGWPLKFLSHSANTWIFYNPRFDFDAGFRTSIDLGLSLGTFDAGFGREGRPPPVADKMVSIVSVCFCGTEKEQTSDHFKSFTTDRKLSHGDFFNAFLDKTMLPLILNAEN